MRCGSWPRQRTFAVTAVVSLALATAASTAAYAVAHTLLWKRLPYRDPGRLVVVWETHAKQGFTNRTEVSFANFLDWRARNHAFEHLTALAKRTANLTGSGDPERLQAAAPSVDFFDMLGVRAALGRTFVREQESRTAEPVAVLRHELLVRWFGADASVVRSRIVLNGNVLMRDGIAAAAIGVAAGSTASFMPGGLLEGTLFGVSARDPLTFALVLAANFLATGAATLLPARRASRVDPVAILRAD